MVVVATTNSGRVVEGERIDGTKRVCLRLLLHIVFVGGEGGVIGESECVYDDERRVVVSKRSVVEREVLPQGLVDGCHQAVMVMRKGMAW